MANLQQVDHRLQINSLEAKLGRALVIGRVVPVSETQSNIFLGDVKVQSVTVDGGNRTPGMSDPTYVIFGNHVDFNISAIMSTDGEGNQVWSKELTQEGVL